MAVKNNSKSSTLELFADGAAVSLIWVLVGFIFVFFFKLFAARYFGPADFGVYALLETIFGFAVVVGVLGTPEAVHRYIPLYLKQKKNALLFGFWKFLFKLLLISGIVMGLLVFLFASKLTVFFNFPTEFTLYLRLLAIVIPFAVVDRLLRNLFIPFEKISRFKFANNVLDKLILVIGLFVIWIFQLPLLSLVILFLVSRLFPLIFSIIMTRKFRSSFRFEKKLVKSKEWVNFSLPLLFSGLFGFLSIPFLNFSK